MKKGNLDIVKRELEKLRITYHSVDNGIEITTNIKPPIPCTKHQLEIDYKTIENLGTFAMGAFGHPFYHLGMSGMFGMFGVTIDFSKENEEKYTIKITPGFPIWSTTSRR